MDLAAPPDRTRTIDIIYLRRAHRTPHARAREIAVELGETRHGTLVQITELVRTLGLDKLWTLVESAKQTEASNGIRTADGSRRRTLGGIFFVLAGAALAPDDRRRILEERRVHRLERLRRNRALSAQAAHPDVLGEQRWIAQLVHVPSGRSADSVAARVLCAAEASLADSYATADSAQTAAEEAIQDALLKLYGKRLPNILPPKFDVQAVPI